MHGAIHQKRFCRGDGLGLRLLRPLVVADGHINAMHTSTSSRSTFCRSGGHWWTGEYALFSSKTTRFAIKHARPLDGWLTKVLAWSPHSPGLNPIERLWDELERAIHKRAKHPTNIEQLKTALHEEWNRLPDELRHKFVDSMPNRVAAVHAAKGYPTAY
jgi:hypothetical protein